MPSESLRGEDLFSNLHREIVQFVYLVWFFNLHVLFISSALGLDLETLSFNLT